MEDREQIREREIFVDEQAHRGELYRYVRVDAARADRGEELEVGVARSGGFLARRDVFAQEVERGGHPPRVDAGDGVHRLIDRLAGDEPLGEEEEPLLEHPGPDHVEDSHEPAASA